ncbi:9173_t:CDS:2, partial [Diversispora eburnea]
APKAKADLVHEYFNRDFSEWNIRDFLDFCNLQGFDQKIYAYLKSLELISDTYKGQKGERAKHLLNRYRQATTKLVSGVRPLTLTPSGREETCKDDKPDYCSARNWNEAHKLPSLQLHSPTFAIGSVGNSGDKDRDEKRRRQTKSGRNIPNYQGFFEATDDDISSQENEQKATEGDDNNLESCLQEIRNETGLDINSQENRNTIDYSDATKEIFSIYKEQDPDGVLIDLRLNSPFFKKLPKPTARSYLMEMDTVTESLVPKIVHDFLVKFFSKNLSAKEWHCEIDDLKSPEPNDPVMTAVVRVIRRTLPQFIKAFSLEDQNPLLNISTIEGAYLNSFVHPCFDAFLWYIANVHYEYGEITSKKHVNRNRADGAGFMADADKYQLVYVEGSRPVAKNDKEINDLEKITSNSKKMFAEIVKDIVKNRRRLPRTYRLNEVDNSNLPRKFSEMKDFVYFYECVLKWALLVRNVTESFDLARTEPRPSRLSFANTLFQLDE